MDTESSAAYRDGYKQGMNTANEQWRKAYSQMSALYWGLWWESHHWQYLEEDRDAARAAYDQLKSEVREYHDLVVQLLNRLGLGWEWWDTEEGIDVVDRLRLAIRIIKKRPRHKDLDRLLAEIRQEEVKDGGLDLGSSPLDT